MVSFVFLQLTVLLMAVVALGVEAHLGTVGARSGRIDRARGALFLLAAVAGFTLVFALADREWPVVLALVPLTFVCLLRFALLARTWWTGWRLPVYTAVMLGFGIGASLPLTPSPLGRTSVLAHIKGDASTPDTIDPEARKAVRA